LGTLKTMATTTVYLIRHAQSRPSERIVHSEWPLSEWGKVQAERLIDLLLPLGIERLVSSPFARCRQTIAPFADRVDQEVTVHDDLRERHMGIGFDEDFFAFWRASWEDFDFARPGFETSREAQRRMTEAMTAILHEHEGRTIGVCSHGNVIGLFLNHLDARNGRETAERLTNPDVLKLRADGDAIEWDRTFRLPGLADLVTDPADTPLADE
jgi:2,3-bisphosphoglycerate-dependent phosphoglycerate mutase